MAVCPKCHTELPDGCVFCVVCGTRLHGGPGPQNKGQRARVHYDDADYHSGSYDHTEAFEPRDISENKVICMFMYLGGLIGLLWAYLSQQSAYVRFHLRQNMKLQVFNIVAFIVCCALTMVVGFIGLIGGALSLDSYYYNPNMLLASAGGAGVFMMLIWVAYGCLWITLYVVRVICFFHICSGKAIEAPIVRAFGFLR